MSIPSSRWKVRKANPDSERAHLNKILEAISDSVGEISSTYTVATLPVLESSDVGVRTTVTDATAPTFLGALVGGGAVVCPCFWNGTTWVAG